MRDLTETKTYNEIKTAGTALLVAAVCEIGLPIIERHVPEPFKADIALVRNGLKAIAAAGMVKGLHGAVIGRALVGDVTSSPRYPGPNREPDPILVPIDPPTKKDEEFLI